MIAAAKGKYKEFGRVRQKRILTSIGRKIRLRQHPFNAALKMRQNRPRYNPSGNQSSQSCLIGTVLTGAHCR